MGQGRLLRDELLDGLRSHGKQSACELAARLGRNEKLVMRHLADGYGGRYAGCMGW